MFTKQKGKNFFKSVCHMLGLLCACLILAGCPPHTEGKKLVVAAVMPHSVALYWERADHSGPGNIWNYMVYSSTSPNLTTVDEVFRNGQYQKTIDVYQGDTVEVHRYTIENLNPETKYYFNVVAYCGGSAGGYAVYRMQEATPTKPKRRHLRLKNVSHNSATVDWDRVHNPTDLLWYITYKLSVYKNGKDLIHEKPYHGNYFFTESGPKVIPNLQPRTDYSVRLTALDSWGVEIKYDFAAFVTKRSPLTPLGDDEADFRYEIDGDGIKIEYESEWTLVSKTLGWGDAASAVTKVIGMAYDRYKANQEKAFLSANFNMLARMISEMTHKILDYVKQIKRAEVEVNLQTVYDDSREYFRYPAITPLSNGKYLLRAIRHKGIYDDIRLGFVKLLNALEVFYNNNLYSHRNEWSYVFQHYLSLSTLQQMLKTDDSNALYYQLISDGTNEEEARSISQEDLEIGLRSMLGSRKTFLKNLFHTGITNRLNMFSGLTTNNHNYDCAATDRLTLGSYTFRGEAIEVHAQCEHRGSDICMDIVPPCRITHKNATTGSFLPVDEYSDIESDLTNFAEENGYPNKIRAIAPFIYDRHKQSEQYKEARIQPEAVDLAQKWIANYRLLPNHDPNIDVDATPDFVKDILDRGAPTPYSGCPYNFYLKQSEEESVCLPYDNYTGVISVIHGTPTWTVLTTQAGVKYFLRNDYEANPDPEDDKAMELRESYAGQTVTVKAKLDMQLYPATRYLIVESYSVSGVAATRRAMHGHNVWNSYSVDIPAPVSGRSVRVGFIGFNNYGNGYLSLAEVKVIGEARGFAGVNLTREPGTKAYQSSTGWGGTADRAIDGNINGNYWSNSVTHTLHAPYSWWQANLNKTRKIHRIVLYNRTDCCASALSNFRVSVLDEAGRESWGKNCSASHRDVWSGNSYSVDIPAPVSGRSVRVGFIGFNSDGNGYLSLAEVKVIGEAHGFSEVNLTQEPGTKAYQSSTGWGGTADRAIDGNINGNYWSNSVTHTLHGYNSWWQANLNKTRKIHRIVLYNRTDWFASRLSNFRVSVLDEDGREVFGENYFQN